MNKKDSTGNCNHPRWRQAGHWHGEGKDIKAGGPRAKCTACGKEAFFTWGEWNEIPKEIRVEFSGIPSISADAMRRRPDRIIGPGGEGMPADAHERTIKRQKMR